MPTANKLDNQPFSPQAIIFIFGGVQLAPLHFFRFMQQVFTIQMELHPVHWLILPFHHTHLH
jgi:hypothetical protein